MKRVIRILLVMALAAGLMFTRLTLSRAGSNEIWVDDDWVGSSPGETVDGHVFGTDAFATIQGGINSVESPGTVHVAAGTYQEAVSLKGGVQVLGAGADVTIIRGAGDSAVVTAADIGQEAVVDGFTVVNGRTGFYVSNSSISIKNNVVRANNTNEGAGGIQAYDSTIKVYQNRISQNSGSWGGAMALHGSDAEIVGNIIDQNDCWYGGAIYLTDSSQAVITNNVVSGTSIGAGSSPGIGIGESSSADIVNNTISGNLGDGIATGTYSVGNKTGSATITNCILWGNNDELANLSATYSNIQDADPGDGNIAEYPMFVDPAVGDYHLKPGSPCIDSGNNEQAPGNDLDGDLRPLEGDGEGDAVVDMGADEYSGPVPSSFPSEVWVDDDYCDGCPNEGRTWGTDAFDRIQDGIDASATSGTVHISPGMYLENIWLRSGMTVKGAGPEATTIDGGEKDSVVSAYGVGIGSTLDGLTITNGTGTVGEYGWTYGGGLYVSNSTLLVTNCSVTQNDVSGSGGGLDAYDSTINVLNSSFINNDGHRGGAITLHNSTGEIKGSMFDNNECSYGGTIFLEDSSQGMIVNTQITRGKVGIGIGDSSVATVSNSTIVKNNSGIATGTQLVSNGTGSATITNCILWGNGHDLEDESGNFTVTYTDIEFGHSGEGNISSDPMFVDPENDDYRLNDYSPCIGAGTSDGAPDNDIEGISRPTPTGTNPDLGAYENSRGVPDDLPSDLTSKPVRLTNTIAIPDIAVSASGRVAVVWGNDSNPYVESGLYYAERSAGGSWPREELIWGGWGSEDPHVVFDSEETIHVVWQGRIDARAGILYTSKPTGGAWSAPVEVSTGPSTSPAFTVDDDNTVHVMWVHESDIFYASKPSGGAWTTPANLSGTATTWSTEPDIAVSIEGTVWVVWVEDNPDRIIYASKGAGDEWPEPATLSEGGASPEITAGTEGTMFAVWKLGGVLYSTLPPGGDWSEPVTIPTTGPYWPDMVIDDIRDIIHVIEIRTVGTKGIYHLYSCKGSMWFSELLFPIDWVSDSSSSTVVGSDGRLHISWFRREWSNHGVYYGEYMPPPDSDGDCLSDDIEALLGTSPGDLDTDDDGVSDGDEDANHSGFTENDETDPLKADTDGDEIKDGVELGIAVPIADPDGEGPLLGTATASFVPDSDPNTATDPLDSDTDGDGVNDGAEDLNRNGRFDPGETDPLWKPLDIFGMELGNEWTYEGTSEGAPFLVQRRVTAINENVFPVPTHVMVINENGLWVGTESYENAGDQMKLWGMTFEDEGLLIDVKFDEGLLVVWSPMEVNDQEDSSTSAVMSTEVGDSTYSVSLNVSLDVVVVGMEAVTLGFDTVEAYRVSYTLEMSGDDVEETDTFDWWVVPYIGVVYDQDADSQAELTSFAIGGGAITEESDADEDNLSDYKEIFLYNTHWKSEDTDSDGCIDGPEVMGGRNPLLSDPQGDLNMDCALDLKDAIDALRVVELMDGSSVPDTKGDVNGDGQIGLEDASFVIQKIGGLR